MKTITSIFVLSLITFLVGAQTSTTSHTDPVFKNKAIGVAYSHYIQLKNALVASDMETAKKASDDLMKSLKPIKETDKAYASSVKVATATTLAEQRSAFTELSNEMLKVVNGDKLSAGSIYLEYCPMVNGNTGGYWLSNENEIKNPYFGDRMLRCGSVKEIIN